MKLTKPKRGIAYAQNLAYAAYHYGCECSQVELDKLPARLRKRAQNWLEGKA